MLKKKISLDKREKYKYFKESVYCQTFYNDLKKKKKVWRDLSKSLTCQIENPYLLSNRSFDTGTNRMAAEN